MALENERKRGSILSVAFEPAPAASRSFIRSLFFFPLALIMAYVVQDRRVPGY